MRPRDPDDHYDPYDQYQPAARRPSGRPDQRPNRGQGRTLSPTARKALLVGLGGTLVVALAVTVLATVAALRADTPASGARTPAPGTATASTSASPTSDGTPGAASTPTNAPFICANAPGSTSTYVFVNADHQLYRVTGCANPVKLTNLDASTSILPLAFSPSGSLLMASVGPAQQPESSGPLTCQELMNPQTGVVTKTRFCEDKSLGPTYPIDRLIAWVDDNTFLEAEYADKAGPVKVLRVNASTLASSMVTTFTWVAGAMTPDTSTGIRLRGDYLYYAGYRSTSEGGAYLHRYSLSTGTDTSVVKLGVATEGPCQVYDGPCNWTGPWDITRDGNTIVYHNPAPTDGPNDAYIPPETPLYAAHADGTSPVQITNPPGGSGTSLSTPVIAPSGGRVAVLGSTNQLVATDGSMTAVSIPANYQFAAWRTDGTALLTTQGPNFTQKFALYTLATKSVTDLANYTRDYVWAS